MQSARDARRGMETMHLAADATRAAGNLEAHNKAIMNLSHINFVECYFVSLGSMWLSAAGP